jgi:hypothetical protein
MHRLASLCALCLTLALLACGGSDSKNDSSDVTGPGGGQPGGDLDPPVDGGTSTGDTDAGDGSTGDGSTEGGVPTDTGPVDITDALLTTASSDCADHVASYISSVTDVNRSMNFSGELTVSVTSTHCEFTSNAIPNHDFNDGRRTFVTNVQANSQSYRVSRTPTAAAAPTDLTLETDNAVFLNGVKLDLLAAGCFGVGDGKIGCFDIDTPFRYDPMSAMNDFGTDSHNAHTQPDGTYHYHGNPKALFADDGSAVSPVIGFAADGFAIRGSWIDDGGTIRRVTSSYRLKSGTRDAVGNANPGGTFDGTFVDDWEYVEGQGDLDECNGMTVDGVYSYYVTDAFPWVLRCYRGTPDGSFNKRP